MEIRLLGPVEVRVAGDPVDVGPARQRGVLAALAADAGRPVPAETLIDRVWGAQVPQRVRHTLYVYIANLRKALPDAVVRRPGGYLLDVDPHAIDLYRFRQLVARARARECPDTERVPLLREAVELWRGEPLAGISGEWAERARQSWRQEYLDAVTAWANAAVRADDPGTPLGLLTELVEQHPLNEPLVAARMRVLHATGRSALALDQYARTRERLAEALGTDPGAELRELHQGILRGERPPARVPAQRTGVAPANLPADLSSFTGRVDELGELDGLIADASAARAIVITAIAGTAGVGKTTLAVHWAHRVRHRFPDGQLYLDLHGFDPGGTVMDPAEAVRRFLDALQVPANRIPVSLDAQVDLYRSLLADRRVLVVLDNAYDSAQVRPLLPGTPGCLVVITSRNTLSGLVATEGAYPITLDLLTVAESRKLLTRRLGARRVEAEPDAVERIIAACARLPLALAVVAARAATQPQLPLSALARELDEARDQLGPLAGDDPYADVRAVISWSYRALTPEAARLFRLLGVPAGPDISLPAAASLSGTPPGRVRPVLAELTEVNLAVEHLPGRYTMHDLLRAYATDVAGTRDTAATRRILDHYLHTSHAAARLLEPGRQCGFVPADPAPGVSPEPLADADGALAWFTDEHRVLVATVGHAAAAGFETHATRLAWCLVDYLYRRGHWHDQITVQEAAIAAAGRLGDLAGQAYALRILSGAHTQLGRLDLSEADLSRALDLYGRAGDKVGQANAENNLAQVAGRRGRVADALDHARQALEMFQADGDERGCARALNTIGWYHGQLGEYEQMLDYCGQALALHERHGHRYGQAYTLDSIGYAYLRLGNHAQATQCFEQALALIRQGGDRRAEADVLGRLGEVHEAAGDPGAARRAYQEALKIVTELDQPDAADLRAKVAALG